MSFTLLRRCIGNRKYFHFVNKRKFGSQSQDVDEMEMENTSLPHEPVMVKEVIRYLDLKENNLFLDMTFGAGGHSTELLKKIPGLKVLALDRDPVSLQYALRLHEEYPNQVTPLQGKFSDLPKVLECVGILEKSIDGVLFDLGCSSMQFDVAERGFSISKDGPLDMRMDGPNTHNQITAANLIAYATEKELYQILKVYGGEKRAYKIAKAIVDARNTFKPPSTTRELCDLIETVCEGDVRTDKLNRKAHIATKTFQALRIFVNNEINELNYGLILAHKYLKEGGRALAISFHSLEDVIVKRHFNNLIVKDNNKPLPLGLFDSSRYYGLEEAANFTQKFWQRLNKKVILPTVKEVCSNPRSRSAKLRAAVKITC